MAKPPPKVTLATLKAWVPLLEETIAGLEEQEPSGQKAEETRDSKVEIFEFLLESLESAISDLESL